MDSISHHKMPGSKMHSLLLIILTLLHLQHYSNAQHPINTIVVLVLENRSFDHMLGWMKRAINPAIDGLTGEECNPKNTSFPNASLICISDDAQFVDPDPGHSFEAVCDQVFGSGTVPTMTGFVEQARSMANDLPNTVMRAFKPENLPVYATIVKEFAVFDRWFSSLPGPTQPNRLFAFSGTSHGTVSHDPWMLIRGFPQKSIFDSLHEDALDFGIYFKSIPSTLLFRNLRKLKYTFKFHLFGTFMEHAKKGKLRNLNVIEPGYFDLLGKPADDDHPSHDVANGQKLVKDVYEALRSSPQWNQSLLIITYDEHGGFYDHVETPYRDIPSPDGIKVPPFYFNFDRLGVRVPTIMVSPWIKRGTVVGAPVGPTKNSEYEHSSIPATIKKIFKLSSDFLTKRDAWAGTFEHILSELSSPRTDCPEVLPEVPSLRMTEADENKGLSEFQSELVELAGVLDGKLSFVQSKSKQMTVKKAHQYVSRALSRFLQARKEAYLSGADGSAIVDMKSPETYTTTSP